MDDRTEFILEMRRNGATLSAIAEQCRITPQRVGHILKKLKRQAESVRGRPCRQCGGGSKVIRVRDCPDQSDPLATVTKRRRECLICRHRWSSTERDDE